MGRVADNKDEIPLSKKEKKLTVDATLTGGRFRAAAGESVYPHPEQGEYGSKENRPDDDDCRGPILATQQTFQEGVEMDDHPNGEEELSE